MNRAAHRFVLTKFDGGVAFDTQTGQICRTWDWLPVGGHPKANAETGTTPQIAFGEYAPTCLFLYEQYPSGTEPSLAIVPDSSTE